MYPYIVCFCNYPLGDIYDAYKMLLRIETLKTLNLVDDGMDIDPSMYMLIEDMPRILKNTFEMLNIHRDCCRVRLMTMTEYKTYY